MLSLPMADLASPQFWLNTSRLLTLLFTLFIGYTTYQTHNLLKRFEPDFNVLLSLPETAVRILLAGICLFIAWLSGLPADALGLATPSVLSALFLGLATGVIIQLAVTVVTRAAIKLFGRQVYSPRLILNILPKRRLEWVLIALAFVPPVAMEELLFRSLWIGGFVEIVPLLVLVVGTSIIFGFMHQPQGKLGMVVTGIINLVFCVLFVWTGQLLVTLVAHYTVNMLQITVAYFQRDSLAEYCRQLPSIPVRDVTHGPQSQQGQTPEDPHNNTVVD